MAITVADFLRILDSAGAASFRAMGAAGTIATEGSGEKPDTGRTLVLSCGDAYVEIALTPLEPRRLGAMSLPLTRVRMAFHGFSESERRLFLSRFDSYYRRGGG